MSIYISPLLLYINVRDLIIIYGLYMLNLPELKL